MRKISDQKTVEELVHKEAEDADDGVTQVINEEHVHHDCLVAPSERPLVAHETHKEDQLVEKLKGNKSLGTCQVKEKNQETGVCLRRVASVTLMVPSSSSAGPRPMV